MAKAEQSSDSKAWVAYHRFARISWRKARLVIDLIRGLDCNQAMNALQFTHKRAAVLVRDVLKSAMANADEQEADMGRLFVAEARIDGGPYYPRWQPKDRGRAHPIKKRTSHIIVKVAERTKK